MTAYDRSKGAYYGYELGRAMRNVDSAIGRLAALPGDSEVEEAIGWAREDRIARTLRRALRAAEMLRVVAAAEDTREVKRLPP